MEIGAPHRNDASPPMEVHYESTGKCLKINDKSRAGIENNAVVSTTQVGGGGAQSGANPSLTRFPCLTGKKQGISWIRPRIGGIEAS